jgi:hypothetical protein
MRRDAPETEFGGVLLHDVPNQALGYAVTPALSGSADAAEQSSRFEFGGPDPCVYSRLNPARHRHGPDVPAFAHEIDNRPVFLSLLQMREVQISQFPPSQTAAKQDRENRAVPFAFEGVGIRSLPKPAGLLSREPVSKPHAEFLDTLQATDAGRQSGLSKPASAASYASRRTAASRPLIVPAARPWFSRAIRNRVTTTLLKDSLGSEQYHLMNSSIACRYPRFDSGERKLSSTAALL